MVEKVTSIESPDDVISNCESFVTTTSTTTKDLNKDLKLVQKTHTKISKLEYTLDVGFVL